MNLKYIFAALMIAAPVSIFAAAQLYDIKHDFNKCEYDERTNAVTCVSSGFRPAKTVFRDVYRQCIEGTERLGTYEQKRKEAPGSGERLGEMHESFAKKCVFWEKKPFTIGTGRSR